MCVQWRKKKLIINKWNTTSYSFCCCVLFVCLMQRQLELKHEGNQSDRTKWVNPLFCITLLLLFIAYVMLAGRPCLYCNKGRLRFLIFVIFSTTNAMCRCCVNREQSWTTLDPEFKAGLKSLVFILRIPLALKWNTFSFRWLKSHMQLSFTDSIYIEIESWCTCKAAAKLSQHVSVVANTVNFTFTSQLP